MACLGSRSLWSSLVFWRAVLIAQDSIDAHTSQFTGIATRLRIGPPTAQLVCARVAEVVTFFGKVSCRTPSLCLTLMLLASTSLSSAPLRPA